VCVCGYGYLCGQRQWTEKLICMVNFKDPVWTLAGVVCGVCKKNYI
jgi:hypothetical protein